MEILFSVIQKSEKLAKIPKAQSEIRKECLTQEFFSKTYESASRGLLQ